MICTRVAIAGVSSEVGKTTLLCELLREFPGWEAIKMTRGHYRSCGKDPHACCVSHLLGDEPLIRSGFQQTYASGKDTGRYWDAGAANVHWVIVTDDQVERGIRLALERINAPGVLIEQLTSTVSVPSIDGASTVVFGLRDGVPTVAPQRPVRGEGGFMQLGFPLSRIFDANPKGRNAGWSAFVSYGFDEARQRDARRFAPVRGRSDLFSGNIQYKLNSWVTFGFEQGYYRTRAANRSASNFDGLPLFRGVPSYTTHNVRSEFATIFTF